MEDIPLNLTLLILGVAFLAGLILSATLGQFFPVLVLAPCLLVVVGAAAYRHVRGASG